MILLAMALMQATRMPPPSGPVAETERKTIVVIGRRRRDTGQALADCIARNCPPDEEMVASLRKADAEFMEGDYAAGRRSMASARRRNDRYAKRYPVLVSEMARVGARLASLLGMRDLQRLDSIAALDALRDGLPATDPRVLVQRLEVADSYLMRRDRFSAAQTMYAQVAADAKRAGAMPVYGRALLRPAIMYSTLAQTQLPYRQAANEALTRIDRTTEPELAPMREAAVMLRARLAMAGGTPAEIESAIAALGRYPATVPIVAVAPAVDMGLAGGGFNTVRDLELANGNAALLTQANNNPEYNIIDQWIDVSFWITPQGKVRDIETVRQGDRSVDQWSPAVRKALEGRRYLPLAGDPDGPGMMRIERYSMVSDLTARPVSRIVGRQDAPHVEVTDLSNSALAKVLRAR